MAKTEKIAFILEQVGDQGGGSGGRAVQPRLHALLPFPGSSSRLFPCLRDPLKILAQVRLCLAKQDYVRAQILSRKVSPRAFVERKGEAQGEIGIEGTAIEEADMVRGLEVRACACACVCVGPRALCVLCWLGGWRMLSLRQSSAYVPKRCD